MISNSADPVKMPRYVAFYLGHHYLSMTANIQTSLSANQCSRTKYFTATCADPEGGGGQGVWTPWKLQKYRVPLQYWFGSP